MPCVRDQCVEGVELCSGPAVHLDDDAVADDERRIGIVRAAQSDQAEVDVLVGEPVKVDALGVHETDAADPLVAHARTLDQPPAGYCPIAHPTPFSKSIMQ